MATSIPFWGLTFPKKVVIPNPRINLCYHIVWFIVFILLLVRFLISQQWLKKFDIANDMFAHTWVAGGDSAAELEDGWEKFRVTQFCLSPNEHDYWWDTRDSSKFTNYACKKPCYSQVYATDCVPAWDLHKSTREYTFLVTSIRSVECTQSGTYYSNHLLSSAEHLQIGLSYGFDVLTPGGLWYVLGLSKSRGSKEDMQKGRSKSLGSDGHFIKTQIVQSDGSIAEGTLEDGNIVLSVQTLFELAGRPDLLDGTRPEVGPNQLIGSTNKAPTTRRVGVDIIITIECGDTENNFWPASWSSEYTCYLSARTGEAPLVEYEHIDNTGYEHGKPMRARKMYGVRVRVETRGHFKIFDSNNFVLQLVAILVLLSIPKNIVLVFMITCLGRLSLIYRRFVYEDFPVRASVAGMITRLIASGNTFHKLQEYEGKYKHDDDEDDAGGGISDLQMKERIREVIGPRHPNHSDDEIEQMVDFCYYTVFKAQYDNARQESSKRIGKITLDGFLGASTKSEKMDLDDLLALFDWKRSRSCFENFFTPSELRKQELQKAIDEDGLTSHKHAIGKSTGDDHHAARGESSTDPKYAGLPKEIASAHKKLDKQMSDVEGQLSDVQAQLMVLKNQMTQWKASDNQDQDGSDSDVGPVGPALQEVNRLSESVRDMNERMSDRGSEADTAAAAESTRQLQKELQVMQAQHAIKYHCFMERLESLEHIADRLNNRHGGSEQG